MSETPENIPLALEQTEGAPAGASFFKPEFRQDDVLPGPPCPRCGVPLEPGCEVSFENNIPAHKVCPGQEDEAIEDAETPVEVPIGPQD